jgi:hypothetical protein
MLLEFLKKYEAARVLIIVVSRKGVNSQPLFLPLTLNYHRQVIFSVGPESYIGGQF